MIEYWHNPRCTKSRQGLALLEEKGAEITVVEYLKNTPTQKRLKEVATLLGLGPKEIMRTKEKLFRELDLADASPEALFRAMAENPILIERPIGILRDRAVIGRPPENLLALL